MYKILLNAVKLFFVLLVFSSCKEYVSPFVFPIEETLYAEEKEIDEVIHAVASRVVGDYLFVSSFGSKTVMHVYKLPELTFVRKFADIGRGPEEIPGAADICSSTSNYLYVRGYKDDSIDKFEVDSLSNTKRLKVYDLEISKAYNNTHVVNDSLFVFHTLSTIYIYDLINNKITHRMDFKGIEDEEKYGLLIEGFGHLIANDSLLVFFYRNKRQIDVYDIHTMKIIQRIHDKKAPERYGNSGNPYTHQIGARIGEEYLFSLYSGSYKDDTTFRLSVEVFDLDRKPVAKYHLNKPMFCWTVSEKHRMIIGFTSDFNFRFYKY